MQGEIYKRERERGPGYIDRDPLVLPVLHLYDSRSSAVKGIRMSSCPSEANSNTPLRTDQFASADKVEHSDHLLVEVAG
jgi:hypothetical protein